MNPSFGNLAPRCAWHFIWKILSNFVAFLEDINVMATLVPGCQMMDPFGLWWTVFNETLSISFFLTGGLNGGVKCDLLIKFFFQVSCTRTYGNLTKTKNGSNSMATWNQGCHDILLRGTHNFLKLIQHQKDSRYKLETSRKNRKSKLKLEFKCSHNKMKTMQS